MDRMPTIDHTFIEHEKGCDCPLCESGVKVCSVCGGTSHPTYNTLTTHCYGMPLNPKRIESILKGELDFNNGLWVRIDAGPLITDLLPDLKVGSIVETIQGDCVVFGFFTNSLGHKGVRLVQVCNSAVQNPEMFSRIYASTSSTLIPALRELLNK